MTLATPSRRHLAPASFAAAALLVSLLAVPALAAHSGGHHQRHGHGGGSSCAKPKPASTYPLRIASKLHLQGKNASCRRASRLPRAFAFHCAEAFSAEGSCVAPAGGRWQCQSRIVGQPGSGGRSAIRCRRHGVRVRFVAYVQFASVTAPLHGAVAAGPGARAAAKPKPKPTPKPPGAQSPYDLNGTCYLANPASQLAAASGIVDIRTIGLPIGEGERLGTELDATSVSDDYQAGLGTLPRGAPGRRLPLYLIPQSFPLVPGAAGLTDSVCNQALDAIGVHNLAYPGQPIVQIAAHEIFHAFADPSRAVSDNWWQEASAEWGTWKAGIPPSSYSDTQFIQNPAAPLDTFRQKGMEAHEYGAWRFVQWLDAKGLIGDPWSFEQQTLRWGANDAATQRVDEALKARGTSLADQLGAFWGDRIRDFPTNGPRFQAPDHEIKPGHEDVHGPVFALGARGSDFTIAPAVKRVEFTFTTIPNNTQIWAVPDTSDQAKRMSTGDTLSYCVPKGDADDEDWPGAVPIIFVNGNLTGDPAEVGFEVDASDSSSGCTNPANNPQCELLDKAGVAQIFGPGAFDPHRDLSCNYRIGVEPLLNGSWVELGAHFPKGPSKHCRGCSLTKRIKFFYRHHGFCLEGHKLRKVGDAACIVDSGPHLGSAPRLELISGRVSVLIIVHQPDRTPIADPVGKLIALAKGTVAAL